MVVMSLGAKKRGFKLYKIDNQYFGLVLIYIMLILEYAQKMWSDK